MDKIALFSIEQLQQISISYDAPAVIPRGLTNVGNWCYVHAVSLVCVSVCVCVCVCVVLCIMLEIFFSMLTPLPPP